MNTEEHTREPSQIPVTTRRHVLSRIGLGAAASFIVGGSSAIPVAPSDEIPQEKVTRLAMELQQALLDMQVGPVRAYVTSDQPFYLQNLEGLPFFEGKRLVGVPVQLLRRAV